MSSDKRQFDDFTKFGGKIDTNGIYVYPTLYHYDSNENKRFWKVFVRLIKSSKGPNYKYGWDTEKDVVIPIEKDDLEQNSDIPDDVVAQVWTESGVVKSDKIARSAPSYPAPANVGKANERNCLKQGLVKARAAYLKQREKGGRTQAEINAGTKSLKKKETAELTTCKETPTNKSKEIKETRYFPMLARNFQDEKHRIMYPVIVQPKLDGMRCIAFLNVSPKKNPTYKNVILYSRNMKDITGFDHLRKELLNPLIELYDTKTKESLYVDGEFYHHGSRLQDIVGEVRNIQKNNQTREDGIKLYLFDCFYPASIDATYTHRLEVLDDFFDELNEPKWTIKVPTWNAKSEMDIQSLYKKAMKDKYEGVMIKELDSPYLTSSTKSGSNLRSHSVLKLKGHFDEEYKIVGFTEGQHGKDVGALIWVLETPDKHQFNATPKSMTYAERYKLFKKLKENPDKFAKKYKNKMITVEYQDKSKDGVPLRAKAILIRDYE
jgi:ATP-dependent DNA ligase